MLCKGCVQSVEAESVERQRSVDALIYRPCPKILRDRCSSWILVKAASAPRQQNMACPCLSHPPSCCCRSSLALTHKGSASLVAIWRQQSLLGGGGALAQQTAEPLELAAMQLLVQVLAIPDRQESCRQSNHLRRRSGVGSRAPVESDWWAITKAHDMVSIIGLMRIYLTRESAASG